MVPKNLMFRIMTNGYLNLKESKFFKNSKQVIIKFLRLWQVLGKWYKNDQKLSFRKTYSKIQA